MPLASVMIMFRYWGFLLRVLLMMDCTLSVLRLANIRQLGQEFAQLLGFMHQVFLLRGKVIDKFLGFDDRLAIVITSAL